MVADDAAVRALFDGPDGVAAGIRPGSVAVDMSTVLPDTIRSLAAGRPGARRRHPRCARLGQRHARRSPGELTIMVGGEAADLERARPSSIASPDASSTSGRSAPARR